MFFLFLRALLVLGRKLFIQACCFFLLSQKEAVGLLSVGTFLEYFDAQMTPMLYALLTRAKFGVHRVKNIMDSAYIRVWTYVKAINGLYKHCFSTKSATPRSKATFFILCLKWGT